MFDEREGTVFCLDKDMFEHVDGDKAVIFSNCVVKFSRDAVEGIRCSEWAHDYGNWAKSYVSKDAGKTFEAEDNYEDLFDYEDCHFAVLREEGDKVFVQVTDED